MSRHITHEITRADDGIMLVVIWEWNNGWNLIGSRRATDSEIALFNSESEGHPVQILTAF